MQGQHFWLIAWCMVNFKPALCTCTAYGGWGHGWNDGAHRHVPCRHHQDKDAGSQPPWPKGANIYCISWLKLERYAAANPYVLLILLSCFDGAKHQTDRRHANVIWHCAAARRICARSHYLSYKKRGAGWSVQRRWCCCCRCWVSGQRTCYGNGLITSVEPLGPWIFASTDSALMHNKIQSLLCNCVEKWHLKVAL